MHEQELPLDQAYYIYRDADLLGPFSIQVLKDFVDAGLIAHTVLAFRADNAEREKPLELFLEEYARITREDGRHQEDQIPLHSAYYVYKDEDLLGPFTIEDMQSFVRSGLILTRDIAFRADNSADEHSVKEFLTQSGLLCKVEHRGSLISQIKSIGKELILPPSVFTKDPWESDNRLFILSLVGLTLSIVLAFLPIFSPFMVFYVVALYFSGIWALFFNYLFRSTQVKWKISIAIFFICQLVVFIAWDLIGLPSLNPFYYFLETGNAALSLLAYVFGVGLTEEFFKLVPILMILHFSKKVMKPQTMVYYGLISGVAFGVYEGVQYQMGANFQILSNAPLAEGYVVTFILNIARLTCLPFLHAVWCGMASYFSAFAFLYPRYRKSLYVLALLIPATLHGLYDFVAGISSLLTIPIVLIAVILLMVYLKINYSFHSKLAD